MIYLITLNPAIDKYISVDDFKLNITNFSNDKYDIFGGKAINVGKIVSEYTNNYEIITTINEKNEEFIKSETKNLNIRFFKVDHIRENLKINDNSLVTEINETTSEMSQVIKNEINQYLTTEVKSDDYVLFAGSVHKEDVKFIKNVCKNIKTDKILIDSTSFTLDDIGQIKPYMIKPNAEEIEKLLGYKTSINESANVLIELGVQKVIISLGGDGSYYKDSENEYQIPGLKGNVINTVGAGDSYVGGFLAGSYLNFEIENTLKLASACASATAFSKSIAKKEQIDSLLNKIQIIKKK